MVTCIISVTGPLWAYEIGKTLNTGIGIQKFSHTCRRHQMVEVPTNSKLRKSFKVETAIDGDDHRYLYSLLTPPRTQYRGLSMYHY